jgi:hypothetical protein
MNQQTRIPRPSIARTNGPSFADIAETDRQQRVRSMINTAAEMNAAKYLRSPEL